MGFSLGALWLVGFGGLRESVKGPSSRDWMYWMRFYFFPCCFLLDSFDVGALYEYLGDRVYSAGLTTHVTALNIDKCKLLWLATKVVPRIFVQISW